MTHSTTPNFWQLYNALPHDIQRLADKNYALLQVDSNHPSLHLKQIKGIWSVRIGINYCAVAYREGDNFFWFWIGTHSEYDKLLS